jgi:hypothetical protein
MQLPIQSGVALKDGKFVTSLPINLEHSVIETGLAKGQLVTTRGAEPLGTGPGTDRGGIMWNGVHYRVMGQSLVTVAQDGTTTTLGTVGGFEPVRFTYSFDRLAVASGAHLFYWDGATLTEVTDPDLGAAYDVTWMNGYFITTDGEFVIVTELLDPTQIEGLKYGSAEIDPDPVTGVETLREELIVFGRHSVQFFQLTGGTGFPFANVRGATVPVGCVSAQAKCLTAGTVAFVGSGREEPLGVYAIDGGGAVRISTEEVDELLAGVDPAEIELESRRFGHEEHLILHLPSVSASFKVKASREAGSGLWTLLHSGQFGTYRPRRAVWDGSRHIVGDEATNALGVLSEASTGHFGAVTRWQFDAGLLYNEGTGLIAHEIEIAGQFELNRESQVFLSMTRDGQLWSNEVARRLTGRREERCIWRPHVRLADRAGFRFRGEGRVAIARADVRGEALGA